MPRIRRYSEMIQIESYEDRFEYLKLGGSVGHATFGFDRWLNQTFYRSREWKRVRRDVLVRDNGLDLGCIGYEIHDSPLVHHMNPISVDDIAHGADWIFDSEYLITTTPKTHNAIHYGDRSLLRQPTVERRPGDTKLW